MVREIIEDPDTSVMVNELACLEEGRPPRETVIALLENDRKTSKTNKEMRKVTKADFLAVIIEGQEHTH